MTVYTCILTCTEGELRYYWNIILLHYELCDKRCQVGCPHVQEDIDDGQSLHRLVCLGLGVFHGQEEEQQETLGERRKRKDQRLHTCTRTCAFHFSYSLQPAVSLVHRLPSHAQKMRTRKAVHLHSYVYLHFLQLLLGAPFVPQTELSTETLSPAEGSPVCMGNPQRACGEFLNMVMLPSRVCKERREL